VALHTINNTIAFSATAGAPGATLVAGTIGLLALSACILIPARARLAVRAAQS